MPKALGFPCFAHSTNIHATAAVAVEIWVTSIAMPAAPSAATALPALKPNQPTQSIEAPTTVSVKLCGGIAVVWYPSRFPTKMAATNAAIPALMCTTVPPAKSSAPIISPNKEPSPDHAMWQRGAYTMIDQTTEKINIAENFIRSANAPAISAGVIIANVNWKVIKTVSGIVPERVSTPIPRKNMVPSPPTKEVSVNCPASIPTVLKARLYPQIIHTIVISPVNAKHCISTERTFWTRTSPP